MRRILMLVPLLASLAAPGQAQTTNATLKSAIDALASAADATEWGKLTTDDAVVVHANGTVHTKRQEMDEIKKSAGGPVVKVKNEEVYLYGTTAIRRFELPAGDIVSQVWLQQTGRWRMVMSQQTAREK
ncbi:MAG TPA: nuclear transport factor 2 family protein [Vicinamibacterales bacterium]|nr:nuclear transport factor 2 family protein [Vicinamibacterales bacterium]